MSKSKAKLKVEGVPESIVVPSPDDVRIIEPHDVPSVKSVERSVASALKGPIESPPLAEVVANAKLVVVLVPDFTRRIPLPKILKALLKELYRVGIDRHKMGMIVALGTHRALEDEELEELVGQDVYRDIAVLNHDWKNENSMVKVGSLEDGTAITINEMVKDADVVIGVGQIRPHRIAGYTGGGKVVVPGISGPTVLGHTHWLSAQHSSEELIFHPDNPIRLAMEAAAAKAGLRFIINVVMSTDDKVAGVFAGHPVKAHREGVAFAETVYPRPEGEDFDIVVATCPSDVDLWQAASGIYEGSLWVKEGGRLILWAPCPEGVASHHSAVLDHGYLPLDQVTKLVNKKKIKDLVAAAHLVHVGDIHHQKAPVTLVSEGISEEETKQLHLNHAPDLQTALDKAIKDLGKKATIAVYRR